MKRILRIANVILLVAFITSCSFFVNTKEIEEKANAAFQDKNFDEFNKLYEKLEKADEEESAAYIKKVKEHDYFSITAYSTEDDLQILESIKKQVPNLSEFANNKIQAYTLLKITDNLDTIVQNGKQLGAYHLSVDTIDKTVETQNTLEDLVSETNKNLTNLEDMDITGEYEDIQENLIESVENYRDKLQAKYMFFLEDQAEVISNNKLALEGNIFAMSSLVDLMDKFEQIQKELEFAGDTLQQRNEAVRPKFGD